MKTMSFQKAIAVVASVLVLGAVVYAFFLLGSPVTQRAISFDARRVQDLQQIAGSVESYHQETKTLPTTLEDLKGIRFAVFSLSDPETQEPYEYRRISDVSYEVCAVFTTDSTHQPELRQEPSQQPALGQGLFTQNSWVHGVGRTCFTREVIQP
ncbi:MAG: hypothetical protein Q8Q38_01955 [bacterium]|nr:hypothetical protein [bacterium]